MLLAIEILVGMLKVGNIVLEQGYCTLPDAFQLASPTVKYTAERARRKLLQMPLACIRVERAVLFHIDGEILRNGLWQTRRDCERITCSSFPERYSPAKVSGEDAS